MGDTFANPTAAECAERINLRFLKKPYGLQWSVDGALPDSGVLLHVFDGWAPRDAAYRPGSAASEMSASLVFADQRPKCCSEIPIPVFQGNGASGLQGIVFRPGVTTQVLCGAISDRSGARCATFGYCDPVIDSEENHAPAPPFSANSWPDGCGNGRAWRPHDAGEYLRRGTRWEKEVQAPWSGRVDYNEFLVNAAHWTAHLPDAIEAFFGNGQYAQEQHLAYLREFGLAAAQVPLLTFDDRNWQQPFTVAHGRE